MPNSSAPDSPVTPDPAESGGPVNPAALVGINLGIVPRNGQHVCGIQFENLTSTCYHYLDAPSVRAIAEQLPPRLLEIAEELDRMNRRSSTGIITPTTGKLVIPHGNRRN